MCAAVDAAHRRHLLHRDLKPENTFLANAEGAEIPKVLDCSLAKSPDAGAAIITAGVTPAGQLLGTLLHMSPEQLRGHPPAESRDLWALAIIAHEMLTGAHPFAANQAVAPNAAILAGLLIPASHRLGDSRWGPFFFKALPTEISSRFASVQTLGEHFEHAFR